MTAAAVGVYVDVGNFPVPVGELASQIPLAQAKAPQRAVIVRVFVVVEVVSETSQPVMVTVELLGHMVLVVIPAIGVHSTDTWYAVEGLGQAVDSVIPAWRSTKVLVELAAENA